MVVGELAEAADLLVVGAGPAGYAAALRAAQLGREVTLVDRDGEDGVGGVCLRVGCIPSKALIELADLVHRSARLADSGVVATAPAADLEAFQRQRTDLVAQLTGGVRGLLRAAGVHVVGGTLRFTRADQAVVETDDGPPRFLQFRDVVLATGSRPVPVPALGANVLDSTGALALDSVPATVAVIGAGYVGVELGTALAKLGAAVTIVEQAGRILPTLDASLTTPVARRLAELGVEVLTGARADEHAGGSLAVTRGAEKLEVKADTVIVAVGRRPNTDDLGLDKLGVPPRPDGLIAVGADRLARPHVAAIGDITEGPALAHKGYAEAAVAVEALCGRRVAFDPVTIPAVVFSDPEIATAGITEQEARAQGLDVTVHGVPMAANGRAATLGVTAGHVTLVADRETGVLLGAHVVGPHASEVIAGACAALELGATVTDLAETIHPHPTVAEHVEEAARAMLGRPVNSSAGT